jgi:hypothetical protein
MDKGLLWTFLQIIFMEEFFESLAPPFLPGVYGNS